MKRQMRKSRKSNVVAKRSRGNAERIADRFPRSLDSLIAPSPQASARLHSIPLLFESSHSARIASGKLGFDSWSDPAFGIRQGDDGHIRRLRFTSGKLTIELVAERRDDGWEFIARAYSRDDVAHEFVMEASGKKLLPQADGFYHWTSKRLLRQFRLISLQQRIVFGGIQW